MKAVLVQLLDGERQEELEKELEKRVQAFESQYQSEPYNKEDGELNSPSENEEENSKEDYKMLESMISEALAYENRLKTERSQQTLYASTFKPNQPPQAVLLLESMQDPTLATSNRTDNTVEG